jgi:hypothetical protein
MAERTVSIDLGGQGSEMEVRFSGSECACEDFQMALVGFARQWVRERRQIEAQKPGKTPCGCKEKQPA